MIFFGLVNEAVKFIGSFVTIAGPDAIPPKTGFPFNNVIATPHKPSDSL